MKLILIVIISVFLLGNSTSAIASILLGLLDENTETASASDRSEYGVKVSEACTKIKTSNFLAKRFGQNPLKLHCKKVTFTCQEKLWHVPEIWRVVVDENQASYDLVRGTATSKSWTLITGLLGTSKYHRLDKMEPWVIIPVEKTGDVDRKLVIHQDKLSGAMVVKKRVFDKQSGYQDAEYRYYCRSSIGKFEQ